MLQKDNVQAALDASGVMNWRLLDAIEACCGHCAICSPDCPIAIARRAMRGLRDDLIAAEEMEQGN